MPQVVDFDDDSLGYSARYAMGFSEGAITVPMTWQGRCDSGAESQDQACTGQQETPALVGTNTMLTLELAHSSEEAEIVFEELMNIHGCSPNMRIPATLRLATADGMLDASLEGEASASGQLTLVTLSGSAMELGGELTQEPDVPTDAQFKLIVSFTRSFHFNVLLFIADASAASANADFFVSVALRDERRPGPPCECE